MIRQRPGKLSNPTHGTPGRSGLARRSRSTNAMGLALAALGIPIAALLASCAQVPVSPARAVDALLSQHYGPSTPGVAVIVIRDGVVLQKAAYGMADLEHGVPAETDTSFRLASFSKQFTAMAIMMLAEQGRLDYDDPVTRFLPELARFGDALTIRHLLTHTGGLPDYYDVMVEVTGIERPLTRNALDAYAVWGEPLFAPGERWEYSNPGYELLALIVERASGERFGDFVERRIFAPLGMKNSVVMDERSPTLAKRALGYRKVDAGYELDDDDPLNFIIGSGGVYSTVEDLYHWDQALYGEQLVSAATLARAFSPVRLNSGETYPYGFGWSLEDHLGRHRVSHGGSWVGFRTFIGRYVDDHFTVILLSNSAETQSEILANTIARLYLGDAR
jgi:CubicO group peptidase (beta-lactamase class C family)